MSMESPHSLAGLGSALVRLAASRDAQAWGFLLECMGADIQSLAARLTGDAALAEDAVQETLLQIRDHAGRFRSDDDDTDAAARRWILGVSVNVCSYLMRTKRRARRRESIAANTELSMPEQPNLTIERNEHVAALRLALTDLPDRYRNAIILHHLAGLDFAGVASELKCPIGTAKTHVRRGLEQLRMRLTKVGVSMSLVALIGTLQQLPAVPIPAASAHLLLLQAAVKPSLSFTSLAGGISMAGKAALAAAAIVVVTAAPLIVSSTARVPNQPVTETDNGLSPSVNAAVNQRSTRTFFQDFSTLPLDEVTPNEFVQLKEGGGDITAIVSQPYTAEKSATWRPDVHIDYYVDRDPDDPKALFLVPEDMEIRIRIRAEQPGKWNPSLVPTTPQSD